VQFYKNFQITPAFGEVRTRAMGTGYAHVAVSKNVCQLIILESRLLLYVAVFFLYFICFKKKK